MAFCIFGEFLLQNWGISFATLSYFILQQTVQKPFGTPSFFENETQESLNSLLGIFSDIFALRQCWKAFALWLTAPYPLELLQSHERAKNLGIILGFLHAIQRSHLRLRLVNQGLNNSTGFNLNGLSKRKINNEI